MTPDSKSVLDGLPDDLAAVLRDQSIIVPQDQAVWELLAAWRNAPSNTASADPLTTPPEQKEET